MSSKRRRRKKKNSKGLSVVFFVVVFFCLCVGFRIGLLKKQNNELIQKREALEFEMKAEEQRTKDLKATEKYMQTKKFKEEVAKEKLGLVYPDEILIEPENK